MSDFKTKKCTKIDFGWGCAPDRALGKLTAAARVTTETRKFDHITPILRELHWLPIRKRIVYKLAVTVYKSRTGASVPGC